MSEKKPYLVDVPVRVNIWIRPEAQRRQFEVLREARPSTLFLISDGGRNEREWEAIRENRRLFDEELDWECAVYKIYEEENRGLYTMARKGAELIWSITDRCIFLEDDYVTAVSFFRYAAELLEKYKDDMRIGAICAMNHTGVWEDASADYLFSETGAIWGIATWRRAYELRDYDFSYGKDAYTNKLLMDRIGKDKPFRRCAEGYARGEKVDGHVAGGEFYYRLAVYGQNQLFIVPKKNMMCNIGCTPDGAHATSYHLLPRAIRRIFNMKTYEYEFPLKHPRYVIRDEGYAKAERRIMAYGHPVIAFFRRIECLFLALRYRGVVGFFKKIKRARANRKKTET